MRLALLALAIVWAGLCSGVVAAQDATGAARDAREMLDLASRALQDAQGGRDRVEALTEVLRAYEAGLAVLRTESRDAARREARLRADLAARETEIARLLGVLQTLSRAPAPARLIHPEGPAGTLRAGLLLADVTPALRAEADALRRQIAALRDVQSLQAQAAETLRDGLAGAQEARVALSQALADRAPLPRRFVEDPVETAVLLAATDTLDAFAAGVATIAGDEAPLDLPDVAARKGRLPLPVAGRVLRAAGQADAAGIMRPGLLLATAAEALVTSPVAATVRYAGPLLDYGQVVLLEPQADMLLVFAGMAEVFAPTGAILPAGEPLGLMPPRAAAASQMSDGGGNPRPETLYIEVRENGRTVDPASWFNTGRE